MKKFKNSICVKGTHTLIEAFAKELLILGYRCSNLDKINFVSCTTYNSKDGKNESIFNCRSSYDKSLGMNGAIHLNLPEDWNKALELAGETIEEIPEYVKTTSDGGNNTSHFKCKNYYELGKIYKVLELSTKEINDPSYVCEGGYCIYTDYIEFSTKEAYDKQQKELADKELLEKLIKESGLKMEDYVVRTDFTKTKFTIKEFKLINKKPNSSALVEQEWEKTKLPFIAVIGEGYAIPARFLEKASQPKTLTLGSSNIKIKISKGKIEAQGREIPYNYIEELISVMTNDSRVSGGKFDWSEYYSWEILFPSVKIGCSTFTLAELEQVINTYNELNK